MKLLRDEVAAADDLVLLPILNKSITEFYPVAEIPARTSPWQAAAVSTVAVKSVLVSYDFRRRDCDTVARMAKIVADNLDWLTRNGHPKWKAVDLNSQLKGWEQYDCVRKYLRRPVDPVTPARRTDRNPVMDAIKQVLGD